MVFVNYSPGEVIVVRKDGSRDFTINIRSGNPLDVTCIDSNTIAVSVVDIENIKKYASELQAFLGLKQI